MGQSDAGRITVEDRVVTKVASRAAAENVEAGGVAARVFGATVPGLSRLGGRDTSLRSLPKTTGEVDGTRAFLSVELAVRYPAPIAEVTDVVRRAIIDRLRQYAGVEAMEVDMVVRALLTDRPAPPRVR
ncbi:MAG: Asp23/Gls24 family envelope stress response protein [Frankia sp.]